MAGWWPAFCPRVKWAPGHRRIASSLDGPSTGRPQPGAPGALSAKHPSGDRPRSGQSHRGPYRLQPGPGPADGHRSRGDRRARPLRPALVDRRFGGLRGPRRTAPRSLRPGRPGPSSNLPGPGSWRRWPPWRRQAPADSSASTAPFPSAPAWHRVPPCRSPWPRCSARPGCRSSRSSRGASRPSTSAGSRWARWTHWSAPAATGAMPCSSTSPPWCGPGPLPADADDRGGGLRPATGAPGRLALRRPGGGVRGGRGRHRATRVGRRADLAAVGDPVCADGVAMSSPSAAGSASWSGARLRRPGRSRRGDVREPSEPGHRLRGVDPGRSSVGRSPGLHARRARDPADGRRVRRLRGGAVPAGRGGRRGAGHAGVAGRAHGRHGRQDGTEPLA